LDSVPRHEEHEEGGKKSITRRLSLYYFPSWGQSDVSERNKNQKNGKSNDDEREAKAQKKTYHHHHRLIYSFISVLSRKKF